MRKELKAEIAIIIFIILIFSAVRLWKISQYNYCLGWDCPSYLVMIGESGYSLEPVFVWTMRFLSVFMPDIEVIKFLQILIPAITSLGIWILLRKRLSWQSAAVAIIALNALLGYDRLWQDNYRNLMEIAMYPFLMHFFLKKNIIMASLLTALMTLTHSTVVFALPAMLLTAAIVRDKVLIKYSIVCSLIALAIRFLYIDQTVYLFSNAFFIPYDAGLTLFYVLFFNNMMLFTVPYTMFKIDVKKAVDVMLVVLFMSVLIFPFLPFVREWNRSTQILSFPLALMAGLFYHKYSDVIKKNKAIKAVFIVMLALSLAFSFLYMNSLTPTITEDEEKAYAYLREFTENDSYVLSTTRETAWISYLTNRTPIRVDWLFIDQNTFENIDRTHLDQYPQYYNYSSNISRIYGDINTSLKIAGELKKYYGAPIYWIWRYDYYVPYNNTMMKEKESHYTVVARFGDVVIAKL